MVRPLRRAFAFDHLFHELAEIDLLHRLLGPGVGREIDELGDEITELGQLDLGRVDELSALRVVERSGALEQLDVRAQRGERRPQFVARVHHEPPLLRARRAERGEHRVEAGGQPAELVVPTDLDVVVELLGLGDLLGRDGELLDRAARCGARSTTRAPPRPRCRSAR